jgi:O-antigen/teichoic acid export membrane protein
MGMSLSAVGIVQSVALSWIITKSSPFGVMIERKEYAALDQMFFKSLKQAIVVSTIFSGVLWAVVEFINVEHFRLAQRLLAPFPFGILLTVATVNVVFISEANYLRSHKQEKFLGISVLCAVFIGLTTYFFGKAYGSLGISVGYLAVETIVGLGLGSYMFFKYRRLWHEQ